jgi:hypothetical protein
MLLVILGSVFQWTARLSRIGSEFSVGGYAEEEEEEEEEEGGGGKLAYLALRLGASYPK